MPDPSDVVAEVDAVLASIARAPRRAPFLVLSPGVLDTALAAGIGAGWAAAHVVPASMVLEAIEWERRAAADAAVRTWRMRPTRGPRMRLRLVEPGWTRTDAAMRTAYRRRQLARRRRNRR